MRKLIFLSISFIIFSLLNSCQKDSTPNNIKPLAIGDNYQGGVVFYILKDGDQGYDAAVAHGLIAAETDQGEAQWGCSGVSINGADGASLGTGKQNTIDIITGCATAGIAARICSDLMLNGYDDWYLPSKDELALLYVNKDVIGEFQAYYYLSSSEANSLGAYIQDFNDGTKSNTSKGTALYFRAIRSF